MIRDYLKNNILITDGAMGTYLSQLTGSDITSAELANIQSPSKVLSVHKEYIAAGAGLIRTNTFAANRALLNINKEELARIIEAGWNIAAEAAEGNKVFIAANIGPVPEYSDFTKTVYSEILDEYYFIIDTFLECGAAIFNFETFSSTLYFAGLSEYIKKKKPDAFIIAQCSININGETRMGQRLEGIFKTMADIKTIDAFGFNCGTGPAHLYNNLKKMAPITSPLCAMPNAGYPEIINNRTVYTNNPDYFSVKLREIKNLGVKILGGCCGTTPLHIKALYKALKEESPKIAFPGEAQPQKSPEKPEHYRENNFYTKLNEGQFAVAVELDPPFKAEFSRVKEGARLLKEKGADIITVADSPTGRVRINSVTIAAKIKREVGIDTLPHLCCRDRNLIGLKSDILGAYVENIRNILIVTGDPIPREEKNEIKSVFNCNSVSLMNLINELNTNELTASPLRIGAAFNSSVRNPDGELRKVHRKIEAGAEYLFTQPIFEESQIELLQRVKKECNIKVLAGILPVVSLKNALFLNNEFPGIDIPPAYVARYSENMSRESAQQTGIEIASELAEKVKPFVDGLYIITPFYRADMVAEIIGNVT